MKKMTTVLAIAAVVLGAGINSVDLLADELLTRQQVSVPDTRSQQWINERNGHDGVLEVHGALLSSPCTLQTNEIALPLAAPVTGERVQTLLSLMLTGCDYGDDLTAMNAPEAQRSVTVLGYSALLTGDKGGQLQPAQQRPAMVRRGGSVTLTWRLTDAQRQFLTPPVLGTLLHLRLNYE